MTGPPAPAASPAAPSAKRGRATLSSSTATADRSSPLAVGVVVWLASEVMFFGGLFAAWFVLKAHNEPNWPPPGEEVDALRMGFFTVVLLASSVTIHFAVEAAEHGRRRSTLRWLLLTIALGTAFLLHEAFEWYELPFGFSSSAHSSIFYLLTGFHGLHVLGGLILMAVVAWVTLSPPYRVPLGQSLRVTSYYWHFVDAVWLVLFISVYVLR
jgi:cytochrome c oxidase subunit III